MDERKNKNPFNRFLALIIVLVFMITTIAIPVYGTAEETETEEYLEYERIASSWRFQDGYISVTDSMPMTYSVRSSFVPWSKTTEGYYINSKGEKIEGAIKMGIDVSAWQGNIDWEKVKEDGVDFAIIRCGYGDDDKSQDDSKWLRNVQQCEKYDIPYGVYIYSYANSKTSCTIKAKSEAAHVLRLIEEAGATPDYPIYYDLEDQTILDNYTRAEIIKAANTFCSAIEAKGYEAGIYASLNWWNSYLNDSSLDKYDKWIAQWYYECQYEGEYRLWQCTSDGTVNGIDGRVDLNFEFQVEGSEGDNDTSKEEQIEGWYEDSDGSKYYYQGGVALTGFKTINGSKYYFNSSGVLQKSKWVTVSGKKYYMKSDGTVTTGYNKIGNYYYLFDSSGVMKTGTVAMSNKKYKLFSSGKACIHTAKTKTSLNYRTGPSTSYKTKGTLKKGKVVSIIRTKNGWSQMANGYWVKSSYTTKVTTYPIFISYKAKTTTEVNYRTGPGTSYKKKGTYKKGKVITIKSTKNGWGKMSNGYWIKLTYTKKI